MSFVWLVGGVPEAIPAPRAPNRVESSAAVAPVADRAAQSYRESAAEPRARIVAEIMTTPVHVVAPGVAALVAKDLLRRRRIRHLPVVRDGRLIGILSDRDPFLEGRRVDEIMTSKVLTARPDCEIRDAARMLAEERIGCLPVVDADGAVLGIVTTTDVLRWVVRNAPLDLWG